MAKGSAARVMECLDLLGEADGVTISSAAERLGVDASSAYRLLKQLEAGGYAQKRGHKYYRGIKQLKSIYSEPNPFEISTYVEKKIREIVKQINIGTHFCMYTPRGPIFVRQELPNEIIRIVQPIGVTEPFHCTASGKAMLAFMPKVMRDELIRRLDYKKYTQNTITDAKALENQLERIRLRGCADDDGEYHRDIYCLCAPVYDGNGFPRYALGISMPSSARARADVPALGRVLTSYAGEITAVTASKPRPD